MKRILILEDNEASLEALSKAIEKMDCKIEICKAKSLEEASRYLFDYRIDLFILDIILTTKVPGDTSGIRFAEKIRHIEDYLFTPIIFTTALADPELHAFRNIHSYGYLEKPYNMEKAIDLIDKALRYRRAEEKSEVEYFRKDGVLFVVDLVTVIYAEVNGRTMSFHMKDDVLDVPYITIKQLLKKSQSVDFLQCSRNTVVNTAYIKSIDFTNLYIQLKDGQAVSIGPSFVKKIRWENRDD